MRRPHRSGALRMAAAAAVAGLLLVAGAAWTPQPARPALSAQLVAGPTTDPAAPLPLVVPPAMVDRTAGGVSTPGSRPAAAAAHPVAFSCGRPGTVIFYSPHADDETLSMGELIARLAACRWRVEVVLVTDGSTSAAHRTIDRYLGLLHLPALSTQAFVAARDREFVAALGRLGAPSNHVHFAGWADSALSVADARSTIMEYASAFPGALHVTMSQWDVNPDHRVLGTALAELAASMRLQARWVVFHRYWASATFRPSCSLVDDPSALLAIRGAADVYARWDPKGGWYAIGIISVARDFRVLRADPRDLVCSTPGPIMTRIPGTMLPVITDAAVSHPTG